MLAVLPSAVAAVAAARTAHAPILLHCAQGVSRSAAVAAGVLVSLERLDSDAAMAAVVAACPRASNGFTRQLALWSAMGANLDATHPAYRAHRAAVAGGRVLAGGEVGALATVGDTSSSSAAHPPTAVYRCRACRRIVATSANAVPVDGGGGGGGVWGPTFRGKQRGRAPTISGPPPPTTLPLGSDGSSLYVEPLAWMADALAGGAVSGKLNCPACAARLGAFDWAGGQTVGGGWMTPCFRLHLARLDAEGGSGGVGVRTPRLT